MKDCPIVKQIYDGCKTLEEVVKVSCLSSIRNGGHKWWQPSRRNSSGTSIEKLRRMFEEQTRDFDVHSG